MHIWCVLKILFFFLFYDFYVNVYLILTVAVTLASSEECPSLCPLYIRSLCVSIKSPTDDTITYSDFPNTCALEVAKCKSPNHGKF